MKPKAQQIELKSQNIPKEATHTSLKDVIRARQQMAEGEGKKLTRRHFLAYSLEEAPKQQNTWSD